MNSRTEKPNEVNLEFDHRVLRLIIGGVAFALPGVTVGLSSTPLSSISASYYTEARDFFVGSLFVVCALFLAYMGKGGPEIRVTKLGALAAFLAAIFPTACDGCAGDWKSTIHYGAAGILFLGIAYLCLAVFNHRAEDKAASNRMGSTPLKRGPTRRRVVYLVCGYIILASIAAVVIAQFTVPAALMKTAAVTFYAELVALWAFGAAWLVASKIFLWFVEDEDESEHLVLIKYDAKQSRVKATGD